MAEQVHLFLEEEQIAELEELTTRLRAGDLEIINEQGEAIVVPGLYALLDYILMWKEPA